MVDINMSILFMKNHMIFNPEYHYGYVDFRIRFLIHNKLFKIKY